MSTLEIYIKAVVDNRGMFHMRALQTLRWYLRVSEESELINAIDRINNLDYLRTLVEAGLKKRLLDAALRRYDELTKRMAGVM